jgi:hypothetical protein
MSCHKYLASCLNDILVETGTGSGKGCLAAINVGFKDVYTIEIDEDKYSQNLKSLINYYTQIHMYLGDSITVLPAILKLINSKATFLLDAHITDLSQIHGSIVCPILRELELVLEHGKKIGVRHSLIIDDIADFNGKKDVNNNLSVNDLKQLILKYDPTYNITTNRRCIIAK